MKQLLGFTAFASAFCALVVGAHGIWPAVIALLGFLIAAHVFGTFVGTRLREGSQAQIAEANAPFERIREGAMPERTPLASHERIIRFSRNITIGGAVLGMTLGCGAIWIGLGKEVTWAGLLMGGVSCGVLGGWMAFMANSFSTIARHAWQHAWHHADVDFDSDDFQRSERKT